MPCPSTQDMTGRRASSGLLLPSDRTMGHLKSSFWSSRAVNVSPVIWDKPAVNQLSVIIKAPVNRAA
jgi:hypothetical protein